MKCLSNIDLKQNSIVSLQNINSQPYQYGPKIYRYCINIKYNSLSKNYRSKIEIKHNFGTMSYYIIRAGLIQSKVENDPLLFINDNGTDGNANKKIINIEYDLNKISFKIYGGNDSSPYDKAYVDIAVYPDSIVTEISDDTVDYISNVYTSV